MAKSGGCRKRSSKSFFFNLSISCASGPLSALAIYGRTVQMGDAINDLRSYPVEVSVPVTYQAAGVGPMDCDGEHEMRLSQSHLRLKAPLAGRVASNC
jgi:hypothetical protein